MEYDAITIDTNIFDKNGLKLDSGLLGKLTQFQVGSVELVLSEIVAKEVQNHLNKKYQQLVSTLKSSITACAEYNLIDTSKIDDGYDGIPESKQEAKKRFDTFVENTGAQIIEAKNTDINQLIDHYFEAKAPFEDGGKKKNEFPDAIALLSLQSWAVQNNKKLLAISEDKGWHNFAKSSQNIDVEADLAKAMEKFQEHSVQAREFLKKLISSYVGQENNEDLYLLMQEIDRVIENQVSEIDIYDVDAESFLSFDYEDVQISCEEIEFSPPSEERSFNVVLMGRDFLVFRLKFKAKTTVSANFSFSQYDSIDKDSIDMGGAHVEREVEFYASALVTIEGNYTSDNFTDLELKEIELIHTPNDIDFGYVEPDYEADYEGPEE